MCPLDFQLVILMTVPVTSAEAERTFTGDKLNVFRVELELVPAELSAMWPGP